MEWICLFERGEVTLKIIRFLSSDEAIVYGVFDHARPEEATVIDGDIFGDYTVTGGSKIIKKVLPPVSPPNVFALGFSYGKHAEETDVNYPEIPVVFIKANSSIIGPGDPIILPKAGPEEVDYEAELAVIIGKKVKNVSPSKARDYIFGYTCANDVSARDWQFHKQKHQWARGKSFDTFCPVGPYIVTADEIEDPDNLKIKSVLNGTVMQDSSTSDMFFTVAEIVSDLSQSLTLLPGTIIMTGTPEGVGFTREPPIFLRGGDTISVIIEQIGELTNPVIKEE
jgi:2-keto-4-pentenoate hydratase/2-oxohepta-3-ene-1,7-dioic acid hydratase in catechol pathway